MMYIDDMMTDLDTGVKVKSLFKAVKLLELFTTSHPERGIKELSDLTGMLKSSVYNILSTFQVCGVIERNPTNGKYRLGKKLMEFYNVLANSDDLKKHAKTIMDRICETCRETVFLAYPSGTDIIYAEASHPREMRLSRSISGVRAEMYCTGVGKAMLAFMGPEALQQVVASGFTAYTPYTLTQADALARELEAIRNRGYAIDNMEHEYGIRCIGVPIFNQAGEVIAGMSISGPSLRIMDEKIDLFASQLLAGAKEIANSIN